MLVIEVMAMMMEVMDTVLGRGSNASDKPDEDGDGHCHSIEAVMHVIDVMAMLLDIYIGLKL